MAETMASLNRGDGTYIEGTPSASSISVPNGAYTIIRTINLKSGHTYIVSATLQFQYAEGANNILVNTILDDTNSNTYAIIRNGDGMRNGGGASLSAIIRATTDITLRLRVYQTSGTTKTVMAEYTALNAYQLN